MQAGMLSLARWAVVLLVVVGLPLLAIPSVSRKLSSLLYGHSGDHLPVISPHAGPEPALVPQVTPEHAPVTFEQPVDVSPPSKFAAQNGLDEQAVPPPPFNPRPSFPEPPRVEPLGELPRRLPAPPNGAGPTSADWKDRVAAVRLQLERWGADYLLLESIGPEQFRFHCRMTIAVGSRETQAFEATTGDPASAAEQVLDEVAAWQASIRKRP